MVASAEHHPGLENGPFPVRSPDKFLRRPLRLVPWLILAGKFLDEIDQAVDRWAQCAINVVDDWPDDLHAAEPDREALQEMAHNAEAFVERAATRHAIDSP